MDNKLYTINFDNVPIKEFIRFIGKISTINFIFSEDELNFNTTIVSKDKTSLDNIMSALVQILRIHGLSITQDGENLLIHRSNALKQIPAVVSELYPKDKDVSRFPIITRIFTTKKVSPNSIAALLKPLLSSNATVEVSKDTMQLIITDTQASINNVDRFINSLDEADVPYETKDYTVKNMNATKLVEMAESLVKPFKGEMPLIMVPKPETNAIYICSTPFLTQKALSILNEIDAKDPGESLYYIYNIQHAKEEQISTSIKTLTKYLKSENYPNKKLITALQSMQWIKTTNSLIFIANEQSIAELKNLLPTFDIHPDNSMTALQQSVLTSDFLVYRPINIEGVFLKNSIQEVSKNLLSSKLEDPTLIQALDSAKWLPESGVLMFTSDKKNLSKVQEIVQDLDKNNNIAIYHCQNYPVLKIMSELTKIAKKTEGPVNNAIKKLEVSEENNSIIIYGSAETITQIRALLAQIDVLPPSNLTIKKNTAIYVSKDVPIRVLLKNLKALTQGDSSDLTDAISNIRVNDSTNTLVINATESEINTIKKLLSQLDHRKEKIEKPDSTIKIYHCKNLTPEQLIAAIKKAASKEPGAIAAAINNLKAENTTKNIIIYGSPDTVDAITKLLAALDQPIAETQTMIYHPKFVSATNLRTVLVNIGKKASSTIKNTIENSSINPHNNTLVFYGNTKNLAQIKEMITHLDHKTKTDATFVYKPKHISIENLKKELMVLSKHMTLSGKMDKTSPLVQAIDQSAILPNSNTIQFVIDPASEPKLKALINTIDSAETKHVSHKDNFLVWNLNTTSGDDLLEHLKQITKTTKDKAIIAAIATGRFIQSSHSLVFSGAPPALSKIQSMLEKLDPKHLAKEKTKKKQSTSSEQQAASYKASSKPSADYTLYKPLHITGPKLIQLIQDFEQHLIAAGVHNVDVGHTIENLNYLAQPNEIIVSGNKEAVKKVIALLAKFDQHKETISQKDFGQGNVSTINNLGFLIYKLRYQQGDQLVSALSSVSADLQSTKENQKQNKNLIDAIQSIKWIAPTNSLIGSGDPKVLTKVSQLIKSIDRPLEQVFIEVLILQTSVNDQLNFGLQWGSGGTYKDRLGWSTGVFPAAGGGGTPQLAPGLQAIGPSSAPDPTNNKQFPNPTGGSLEIMGDLITHCGKTYATLGSLINSLKSIGESSIVLSQKVVTQDNQITKIFDGQNIPFTGSLVTTTGISQTTNANLEYRNIGTTLTVTPTVGDEGVINLDISLSISETPTSSNVQSGSAPNIKDINGIQTTLTTIQTKTQIKDQTFLMLGGSYRNNTTRAKYGAPCLGGLPIVGGAFSTANKLIGKTGIIMFIRPQIIKSNDEYMEISKKQEEIFLRNEANAANLKEAFNLMLQENQESDQEDNEDDEDDEDEDEDIT